MSSNLPPKPKPQPQPQPLHYFSLPQLKWKKNRNRRSGDPSPAVSPSKSLLNLPVNIPLKNKADESETKTWNLRPRRPLYKPNYTNTKTKIVTETKPESVETKWKNKFSIELTNEEIEEDFLAITGAKPSKRPKKKPKAVQKQLDKLFPGLWLGSITPETYQVPEEPPAKG